MKEMQYLEDQLFPGLWNVAESLAVGQGEAIAQHSMTLTSFDPDFFQRDPGIIQDT